ncbi:MAG: hypothetical protein IT374_22440 [Polyangiaceae bacterium]|nr:hypothetical protein [Polyangiaceae bacterium]
MSKLFFASLLLLSGLDCAALAVANANSTVRLAAHVPSADQSSALMIEYLRDLGVPSDQLGRTHVTTTVKQ